MGFPADGRNVDGYGASIIRLLINLLGVDIVRRRWRLLAGAGAMWAGLGVFVFLDALDGTMMVPVRALGLVLLAEGAFSLLAGVFCVDMARRMRWAKGLGVLLIGMLVLETSGSGDIVLALLIGMAFLADGTLKIVAARVVRFRGWRTSQAMGLLSLLLGIFMLQPWPTGYVGTIGANIGLALFLSGLAAMVLAQRLRGLAPGAPIADLLYPASTLSPSHVAGPDRGGAGPLVVHVWTPGGTVNPADRRPGLPRRVLLERYIAAVDRNGLISTGHAALELAPDVYISHYPAVEIEHLPADLGRILRATRDNDAKGVFKPSYAAEAAEWCESTRKIRFRHCNAARLRSFWHDYRRRDTYNLTDRNCASVVAAALDAALEGTFCMDRRSPWQAAARAIFSPELWAATVLRRRAETMAWTPGLLSDYARALSAVVEPPGQALTMRLDWARRVTSAQRRQVMDG